MFSSGFLDSSPIYILHKYKFIQLGMHVDQSVCLYAHVSPRLTTD